jgi:hypothetical protein
VKPVIDKYFVVTHIDVQEAKEKGSLNTPGGEELLKRLGGPAGLPFYAFVDSQGNAIVNSMRVDKNGKPANIGHPDTTEEIDWFLVMVRKAAPQITADEAGVLEHRLRSQHK